MRGIGEPSRLSWTLDDSVLTNQHVHADRVVCERACTWVRAWWVYVPRQLDLNQDSHLLLRCFDHASAFAASVDRVRDDDVLALLALLLVVMLWMQ